MGRYRRALEEQEYLNEERSSDPDARIRGRVAYRYQAQGSLYLSLLVLFAVNGMLWAIWWYAGGGFPWPIFITFASIIGVGSQAMRVYQTYPGPSAQREAEIDREVDAEKHLNNADDVESN